MIGLALSGGGSRAMAFHLGCLRALSDLGVLDDVAVLSTISGGSVIGAYYAYTPHRTFAEFEDDIRTILQKGLQRAILRQMIAPSNVLRSRTELFSNVLRSQLFPNLALSAPRRNNMDVVIGACELRTGTAFRFANRSSGGWRYGELIDNEADVAFAVTASAAYPLFLPAVDRTWTFRKKGEDQVHRVLLTDGGVYDNLGVAVLEPGRNAEFSIHTFPCDHLVVCSAGQGQESGKLRPARFFRRVSKAFEIIHRRVQDSSMQRLHALKQNHLIKGFALPYLGQQDDSLPYKPPGLIPRGEVIGYPTDFAAMSREWIDRLSGRGEQLTRLLVPHYIADVCR
jgi:NTE family protein